MRAASESGREDDRHDARLLVGLRPPVPRRQGDAPVLAGGRRRRVRLRARPSLADEPPPPTGASSSHTPTSCCRRRAARPACWPPTASRPTASRSTRTACPRPTSTPLRRCDRRDRRPATRGDPVRFVYAGGRPRAEGRLGAATRRCAAPRPAGMGADRLRRTREAPRRRRASTCRARRFGSRSRSRPEQRDEVLGAADAVGDPVDHARDALDPDPRGAEPGRAGRVHRHARARRGRRVRA